MYYSEELIEEVRSSNDIVDVVGQYVKLKRSGSNYVGLCPFHNEKTGSFSVSQNKQMYKCFGCGVGGNVVTFLMEYEKMTFVEAVSYLAERVGIKLPQVELSEEDKKKANLKNRLLEINKLAARYFFYQLNNPPGVTGKRYFEKRGLSEETQKNFGLGYSNIDGSSLYRYLKNKGFDDSEITQSGLVINGERGFYDRFRDRVMFPIMDINSKVIGFGGRILGDGEPKYLNSPETLIFDKGRNLYGMNFARSSRKPNIILCEGYMDVIALHQAGFDQAVAALGTAFTLAHALLLKRYTTDVLMTFDSDGAGVKAAIRAIPIMRSVGLSVRAIDMRPYKDPDEFIKNLGADEFQKRIDGAINSFMYKIDKLSLNYNLQDPAARTQFINVCAKELTEFEDEIERESYIQSVSDRYRVNQESLTKLVNRYGNEKEVKASNDAIFQENKMADKKDDGVIRAKRILLSWMVNEPLIYNLVSKYIDPGDFTDELYVKVAAAVYEQLQNQGTVIPAKIINMFTNEEEHKNVAIIFGEDVKEDIPVKDKEKMLNEMVVNIKKDSLNHKMANYMSLSDSEKDKLIQDRSNLHRIKIVLQ